MSWKLYTGAKQYMKWSLRPRHHIEIHQKIKSNNSSDNTATIWTFQSKFPGDT